MASYYAQIDVNLYEGDGNLKKATTPKPTMLLTTKPKVQANKQKNFTFPTSPLFIIGFDSQITCALCAMF